MACKRALQDDSNNEQPPNKRVRLSSKQSQPHELEQTQHPNIQNHSNNNYDDCASVGYKLKEASKETVNFFSSFCLSNHEKKENFKKDLIGNTEYFFEFRHLINDDNDDIFQRLGILFGDKLCDWKHYLSKQNNNNFIVTINDFVGIMRGAILFILYEMDINIGPKKEKQIIIKIPLTGVDLHLRRQGLGKLVSYYLVSKLTSIINKLGDKWHGNSRNGHVSGSSNNNSNSNSNSNSSINVNNDYCSNDSEKERIHFEIIVLVIDASNAPYFWQKCGFVKIPQRLKEYQSKFDRKIKDEYELSVEKSEKAGNDKEKNKNKNENGNDHSSKCKDDSNKNENDECKDLTGSDKGRSNGSLSKNNNSNGNRNSNTGESSVEEEKSDGDNPVRLRKFESESILHNWIFQFGA